MPYACRNNDPAFIKRSCARKSNLFYLNFQNKDIKIYNFEIFNSKSILLNKTKAVDSEMLNETLKKRNAKFIQVLIYLSIKLEVISDIRVYMILIFNVNFSSKEILKCQLSNEKERKVFMTRANRESRLKECKEIVEPSLTG